MSWYQPVRSRTNYPDYCNTAQLRYFTTGENNNNKNVNQKSTKGKGKGASSSNASSTRQKPGVKRASTLKSDGGAKKKKSKVFDVSSDDEDGDDIFNQAIQR